MLQSQDRRVIIAALSLISFAQASLGQVTPPDDGGTKLIRMHGSEIVRTLSGHQILPDSMVGAPPSLFSETFYPDGRWMLTRQQRTTTFLHGRWQLINDQLQISAPGYPEGLRTVFKNERGQLYINDLQAGRLNSVLIAMVTKGINATGG